MTIEGFCCWVLALVILGCAWLAVLAGTYRLTNDAPAAIVLFPSEGFLRDLPSGTALVGRSRASVTLVNAGDDFVHQLYRAGARLVLPAGLKGCG
jgi:hypothetical protein